MVSLIMVSLIMASHDFFFRQNARNHVMMLREFDYVLICFYMFAVPIPELSQSSPKQKTPFEIRLKSFGSSIAVVTVAKPIETAHNFRSDLYK